MKTNSHCIFSETNVIAFARREIASTVGLDTGAHFFLAGGAFKSLLTDVAPRDLDLWATSENDRNLLIDAILAKGAKSVRSQAFADAFDIAERVVDIPHETEFATLRTRLAHFDLGLSAVGVECFGNWSAMVDPLAIESIHRREILLLKPLANWKYALTTLERMRRYAQELGFSIPPREEREIWRVFESQDAQGRKKMINRYKHTGFGGFDIMEALACRYP